MLKYLLLGLPLISADERLLLSAPSNAIYTKQLLKKLLMGIIAIVGVGLLVILVVFRNACWSWVNMCCTWHTLTKCFKSER